MSEKIQKVLARAGVASRRAVEELIRQNKVTINGKRASLGDRATQDDVLAVNGRVIDTTMPDRIVMMYHKPEGVVCSREDDQDRPLIFDQLPECRAGRWLYVGRLDINSSGLLLVTNDGVFANNVIHPSQHLTRTYLVRMIGELSAEDRKKLQDGIELEDGKARFVSIKQTSTGKGRNRWYEVVVEEGRNRIIRRLFEAVNCSVNRLIRIKISNLSMPRDLTVGECRELTRREMKLLTD